MVSLLKTKDHNRKISEKEFVYLQCGSCGLISISEKPHDLGKYYSNEYYQIPSLGKLIKIAQAERFKIEMVKKFKTSGSLLEIGPAFGVFAYQAKESGFKVDTIEMDKRCCEYLRDVVGVNAVLSDVPQKAVGPMKQHDVIAMWHVLEHLIDPWECLTALTGNLSPGGILLIATPNPEAFQFKVMGAQWPHIDAPRHLNLIPREVLTGFLEKSGLELTMFTMDDFGARSWNRFGWQRYLMNRFSGKWMQRIFFVMGLLLSFPMEIVDRKGFNGCAYTAIYRKKAGM